MNNGSNIPARRRAQYLTQERETPKVLIVDHHPTQRLFLEQTLRRAGHEPWVAEDGPGALSIVGTRVPDVCFIDWMLPGKSGLELARAIRGLPGGERCYIIMLTARASPDDMARAFEAGVDDLLGKPVGGMELRSRLKAALRLASLRTSLAEQVEELCALRDQLARANAMLRARSARAC